MLRLKDYMKYKIIYNPSIARQLLHLGNDIKDIKPNKLNKKETIFIFECNEKLLKDLTIVSNK